MYKNVSYQKQRTEGIEIDKRVLMDYCRWSRGERRKKVVE